MPSAILTCPSGALKQFLGGYVTKLGHSLDLTLVSIGHVSLALENEVGGSPYSPC